MRKQFFIMWFLILGVLLGQSGTNRGSQSFSAWYKSAISITGSSNETLTAQLQQLQDGYGNLLPIWVATDSTKITGVFVSDTSKITAAYINKLYQDIDANGYYILNEQGRADHVSNTMSSPYYRFDGVDDNVNVGDQPDLDMGTNDFALMALVKPGAGVVAADRIINKWLYSPGVHDGYALVYGGYYLSDNSCNELNKVSLNKLSVGTLSHVTLVADRDGNAVYYINGNSEDSADMSSITDMSNTYNFNIGAREQVNNNWTGEIFYVKVFNLALTATEVKQLMSGSVPFEYQGASQTEIITNSDDRDFTNSGSVNWANSGLSTLDFTGGDLHAIADTQYDYTYLSGTYMNGGDGLIRGKRYRLVADVTITSGTWKWGAAGITYGPTLTSADNGTVTFEFTHSGANSAFLWQCLSATGESNIDNISIIQIGLVVEYDGSTAGHNQWGDKQNGLYGTVNGPTLENTGLPHSELYTRTGALEVSGETTLTNILPARYEVASIAYKNTTANAITSFDVGFTDGGGEVVAATAIGASTVGTLTIASGVADLDNDDTLYLSAGTWNSGSLELYFTLRRIK